MSALAIGIDDHNGWAIYVCLQVDPLRVVQKGRFELTDETCHAQPYHHESLEVGLSEGEASTELARSLGCRHPAATSAVSTRR